MTSSFFSPDISWKLFTPLQVSPVTVFISWSSSSLTIAGDSGLLSLLVLELLDKNSSFFITLDPDLGLLLKQ